MALSDDFLMELRQRADIESVVSSYVTLKRKGKILSGLCPFHNEKTPSFTVYPETQSFYCFGCGHGGDVITFIRDIENLDYIESVKLLADRVGLALPQDNFDNGLAKKRTRMYEANREAARFFHAALYAPQNENALSYFHNRELSDATIRKFGLGYAPDTWDSLLKHLKSKGFREQELFEANLIRKSQKGHCYDAFKNRVMFPIIDLRGNVVAFGGRVLDDSKPKYLNTNDTLIYKKGRELFALNLARKSKENALILCEGYMDVIALHQAGFTNAIAGLGTALTEEQAHLLSRYAGEVIICYDSDEAGQAAAQKAMRIFSKTTLHIRVIHMQGGKDPDEIIKKYGVERFKDLIEGAANDIEYRLLREKAKYNILTPDGKASFLREAAKLLAAASSIEREIYAGRLADELSVSKDAILHEVKRNAASLKKQREKEKFRDIQNYVSSPDESINKVNPERAKRLRAAKAEEMLIALLINNSEIYRQIQDKVSAEDFITDFNRRIFAALTERLRDGRPLGISFLSSDFTPEEMSALARIQAATADLGNTVAECNDCIKVLLEEKNKTVVKSGETLTDDAFMKLFQKSNT